MRLDFTKMNHLIPVIIQEELNNQVLMLGYMNEEALRQTKITQKVVFYSRSKKRLWMKGETSGHFLNVKSIQKDCDADALLIKVNAQGPTCHTGSVSCFETETAKGFIYQLENTIEERIKSNLTTSYTRDLWQKGINKIAQKVGEEAVELVIEAKDDHVDLFKNEAADLLYHYLILLKTKQLSFENIEEVLKNRIKKPK